MIDLHRRRLLAASGNIILLAGLGRAHDVWAQPRLEGYPYTLGVAAGDPQPDGFVIWTRLCPKPLEEAGGMPPRAAIVRWEVAEDERFSNLARAGEAIARPELAHAVHVEVDGLKPGRRYWYRFTMAGADASPTGTARTAPPADADSARLRLGVAGCQNYESGYFDAFGHLSREDDLDAVFHYGDYIYEATARRPVGTADEHGRIRARAHLGQELYSLDQYRRQYALYKSDSDLQAAHAAAAFIVSFDDHEVDNNWAADKDQDGTPAEIFALRRTAALQAWYEHMPVRRAQFPRNGQLQLYRRLDYGRLMRLHLLDTRSYRDDQLCSPRDKGPCRTQDRQDGTLLGTQQEAWLARGMEGGRRWNLIAQQVMMMPMARTGPDGRRTSSTDTWNGYPAARRRLIEAIEARGLTNVVIASGDAHHHYAGVVPARDEEPDGRAAATEFLATSISSEGDGTADMTLSAQLLRDNPNLKLHNQQRGYQLFDVTPAEWRTTLKVMDKVTTPGGQISTLKSFVVEPHQALMHEV
ncbi:alkaline phosphatase D family protein [Caulobacter segnis]|uniref:alkaline phosphatase D family protein n=1 Tax=Caulobacter segnis TaxID=88688 RepID=UPI00240F3AB0|nr:alkaline phosphatase D family protein [Caulobacter segnis]MDG2520439.1 alkaline phosphatase D family protein [Caulobacter segnis]